jgi:hypothetical protein
MKGLFTTLTFLALISSSVFAQKNKKEEITGDYFQIKGSVYEIDMLNEDESKASNVQVIVYQEKEIYVAFFTDEKGIYNFYLPVGFTYEIWFGGSAFVNKKVEVQGAQIPKEKKPRTVPLDMGLFRPIEGFDFPVLNDPFVLMKYDNEADAVGPDMEYTEQRSAELSKYFKKVEKEMKKKK